MDEYLSGEAFLNTIQYDTISLSRQNALQQMNLE